jgi:pyruvate dehydrogenase (quinone)
MVSAPEQMRHMVDRAMRITQVERNVCCIIVPNDIQEMDTEKPPREHRTIHSGTIKSPGSCHDRKICNVPQTPSMPTRK